MSSITSVNLPYPQHTTLPAVQPQNIIHAHGEEVQRGLLFAATACSIISIIPPCRLAGALALRTIALLSCSLTTSSNWSSDDSVSKLSKITQTAGVALGLVALAAAFPALLTASLAVDLGVQVFEAGKCARQGNKEQALLHLGMGYCRCSCPGRSSSRILGTDGSSNFHQRCTDGWCSLYYFKQGRQKNAWVTGW